VWIVYPRGESFKKVGLLNGPNPTANLVSVNEKEGGACETSI
jgi:hypothetical protein